jgi:carbohydrate binding protein with CBM6 domain
MRRVRVLLVRAVGLFALFFLAFASVAFAATRTVCASGCAYSEFQDALEAAQPGDTILLRAGETFVGPFWLPNKGDGPPILIRSDAPDASLPPDGTRLIPFGYDGGNTDRGSLPRLVGRGATWKTTPIVQTVPGAHGYRLQFIEIDGIVQEGWETLVEIGNNTWDQATLDAVPWNVVLDRVYIHGHPTKGQKRCLSLNGRSLEVRNSYIAGCMNFSFDAQAIAGFNGPGPIKIVNNYLEASGENILFGGADPKISGLVPADIEIRGNLFSKPLAWRDPILSPPPGVPTAFAAAGAGAMNPGTYFVSVVAVLEVEEDIALSAPSAEQAVFVPAGGSALNVSWNGVGGADRYRIYIGDSPGRPTRYIETSSAATSFSYTGSGETWSAPPGSGTKWNVKNLLELKNAERVLVEGNVFEHIWPASQNGFAILLTPRNEDGAAPWSVVRDITIRSNIIRHAANGITILGEDDIRPSQRTGRITIQNNLAYDLSAAWGGPSHFLVISRSPYEVTVDHNTIFHEGMVVLIDDGASSGFVFTNNVAPHNTFGVFGSGAGVGSQALATYFPDAVFRRNALGGGPAAAYPPDNFFPDLGTFLAQFVNAAGEDYRLVPGSIFRGAATDGTDIGVSFAALEAAGSSAGGGGGGATPGPQPGPQPGPTPEPTGGTPTPLPGVLQAEDFDAGDEGTAYHDLSSGNSGGQYRQTDVDVDVDGDGGFCVGWAFAGEWLVYTTNVTAGGAYQLEVSVASQGTGGTFHIEADGHDITGPLSVPDTGGWQSWMAIRRQVSLSGGVQRWRVVLDANGSTGAVGNFNWIRVSGQDAGGAATPFGGTAPAIPGVIEVENFDEGVEGVAYHDSDGGNAGGAYRGGGVDIAADGSASGGLAVGWVFAREWLDYTVNVAAPGTYGFEFRVASAGRGGTFHLEANGQNVTGSLAVPDTGGWGSWTVVRGVASLNAGVQVWRLVMDSNGDTAAVGNFDVIAITGGGAAVPFGGAASTLPGTVQAEDFDLGGEGLTYGDATSGNAGGAYRTGDVDIAQIGASEFTVGWTSAGEWMSYTTTVSAAGLYTIDFRVASLGPGGTFHLESNGQNITGTVVVPDTGGWDAWTVVGVANVSLTAGPQTLRLVMDRDGPSGAVGNIDYFQVR